MYVNFYENGDAYAYESSQIAKQHCTKGFVSCVRVEYEEGQFDE